MDTFWAEYFADYAKCYDDFDSERLANYFYVPTVNAITSAWPCTTIY